MKKVISVILSLVLTISLFSVYFNVLRKADDDCVVKYYKNDILTCETEADGVTLRCTYDKRSEEYALYLDDTKYNVNVDIVDGCAFVYLDEGVSILSTEDMVVGQASIAIASTSYLWAPAIIAAAKVVIAAAVTCTIAVTAYYSAELIADTMYKTRTNQITKSKVKTNVKEGVRAIDIVKKGKYSSTKYYFLAYLYKGMVMVGSSISKKDAVLRLKMGKDVFASNSQAALIVAREAAVPKYPIFHKAHRGTGMGDMFPHYHVPGVSWVVNPEHMPHCWFPA